MLMLFMLLMGSMQRVSAQIDENTIIPQAPSVSSITACVDRPVSYFSGTVDVNIPLCSVKAYDIELPVSICYSSTGCRPAQEASWVGLGWNFSLNALISRTVKCTDDFLEYGPNGYFEKGYYTSDPIHQNDDVLPNTYFAAGELGDYNAYQIQDSEPDVFYFSFWGGSSKFIIDKYPGTGAQFTDKESGWKLQIGIREGYHVFTLFDRQGTRYEFFKREDTSSYYHNPSTFSILGASPPLAYCSSIQTQYTSSWFLSRIITPKGHEIDFEYEREVYISPLFESCQHGYYNSQTQNCETGTLYFAKKSIVNTWRLKEVSWDNGSIRFLSSIRPDVARYNDDTSHYNSTPSEKLDAIEICDAGGSVLRKFSLSYSCFSNSINNSLPSYLKDRIRLDSVTEDTDISNHYTFGYIAGDFPAKNTQNTDYWGYNNGADYGSAYYCQARDNNGTIHEGRVKSSNYDFAKIGMLSSVEYPTKGTESFEYELNHYYSTEPIPARTVIGSQSYSISSYYISYNGSMPQMAGFQQVTASGEEADVDISISGVNNHAGDVALAILRVTDGGATVPVSIITYSSTANGTSNATQTHSVRLPQGTYYFIVPVPAQDLTLRTVSATITNYSVSSSNDALGAGLRIKRITGNGKRRDFTYSEGTLLVQPVTGFLKHEYASDAHRIVEYFTQSSESFKPLMSMSHGNLVGYADVTETDGIHTTRYHYYVLQEFSIYNRHPMVPVTPNYYNGKLLEICKYDGSVLLERINYDYHINRSARYKAFYVEPGTATCRESSFDISWYTMLSETTILYDGPDRYVTSVSNEIDDRLQPVSVQSTRNGVTYRTSYRYVYDDMYQTDAVCRGMAASNRLLPVEILGYADGTLISGERNIYEQSGTLYLPKRRQILAITSDLTEQNRASRFSDEAVVDSYDAHGNILQLNIKGATTSYIWGYGNELPIAQIENCTRGHIQNYISASDLDAISGRAAPTAQDYARLEALRTSLPQCAVTIIKYDEGHNVSEICDASGGRSLYKNDPQGRLRKILLQANGRDNLLKSYDYVIGSINLIRENTYLSNDSTDNFISLNLFDSYGRPTATARGGLLTAQGSYLTDVQTYDQAGRVVRNWIPAGIPAQQMPQLLANLPAYYATQFGDSMAYALTGYDALDRVTLKRMPGETWSSTPTTYGYSFNRQSDGVIHYTVQPFSNTLSGTAAYEENQLQKVTVTDPDGNSVITFTDKNGHVVLERRNDGNEQSDTYHVYDSRGLLRFVLSPSYQQEADLDRFAYQYRYDERERCVYRKLPGCAYTQMWYDSKDRMTAFQDGELRSRSLFRVYTYDNLDRLVRQGTASSATAYPADIELQNYYDNYDFVTTDMAFARARIADGSLNPLQGKPTGTMQKANNGETVTSIIGYDGFHRPDRTVSYGLGGRITDESICYSYSGQVDSTKVSVMEGSAVIASGTNRQTYYAHTILPKNAALTLRGRNGSAQTETIQDLSYDAFGQISSNNRGGSVADMTYDYDNLHGWLTRIQSSGGFDQKLFRESGGSNSYFNGSIAAMTWSVPGENATRRYDYIYDGMNRLTGAAYSEPQGGTSLNVGNRYGEMISYDRNSNIASLQRNGMLGDQSFGLIDDLTIEYNGNQLKKVTDLAGVQLAYDGASDFVDATNNSTEYTYNSNGALTRDLNRGIDSIEYDLLGNVKRIDFSGNRSIQYVYSADGRRLRTIHSRTTAAQTQMKDSIDYVGNLILKDGHPSQYLFDGGYASFSNDALSGWHYYIQDYMGNNRMVVNRNGSTEQVTHYYPYGGVIGGISTNETLQAYKFEGKELDRTFGLDTYDVHARNYFPMLPMWDRVDPLAEKYFGISPYAYCVGDPMNYKDPDGLEVHPDNYNAFVLLLNSISPEDRDYIVLNKAGNVDYATMQSHNSESQNYAALMNLVASELTYNIFVQSDYSYMDNDRNINNSSLSYFAPDIEFADPNFLSPSGLTTGETGKYGITLLPGQGNSGVNSPNQNVHIYIHPSLSPIGQAEALSHELYGHGFMYDQYRDRSMSGHDYRNTSRDHNDLLRSHIRRARMETVSYFK